MGDLSPMQRDILRRRFWDGLTLREIGEADGVSLDRVWQREKDAIKILRNRRRRYHLDEFAEKYRVYIDERTPWYMQVGVGTFSATHSSAVEELAMKRERMAESLTRRSKRA